MNERSRAPTGTARRKVVEACMAALFAIAMDPSESSNTRVAAITRILDREIGRPVQTRPAARPRDASALSDDELMLIAQGGRQRAASPTVASTQLCRLRGDGAEG